MDKRQQKHFAEPTSQLFTRLRKVSEGWLDDEDKHRALRVFEAFIVGVQRKDLKPGRLGPWSTWMDETLRRDLDHKSLMHFVGMLLDFYEGSRQSEKAMGAHTESHAIRNDIYVWMDANYVEGMALDDAATALAGKVVPLKWRTVRDHLTEWRKLRSAGKP